MGTDFMDVISHNSRSHALRGNVLGDTPRHRMQERPDMGSHAEHGNQNNFRAP